MVFGYLVGIEQGSGNPSGDVIWVLAHGRGG
jgi:hypothetical protein